MVSVEGCPPSAPLSCAECGRTLEATTVFAPLDGKGDGQVLDPPPGVEAGKERALPFERILYCSECRSAHLGPACHSCGRATSCADSIIALDHHWHKECFRCSHESCQALLGERYFAHEGQPFCRTHFLERAGERCAACNGIVDGGLRALGRAWHEGCLRCAESDQPLIEGSAFLHEGRPIAPTERVRTAPRCHACGDPATSNRVYAHGAVYHSDCFQVTCSAI